MKINSSDKKQIEGLTVNSRGIIYILKTNEKVPHRFNQMGQYLGPVSMSGLPVEWKSLDLKGIAIDRQDRLFCLDQQNCVCLWLDLEGKCQGYFPIYSKEEQEKSSEKNKSISLEKSRLSDIAVSNNGWIVISDNGRREIHIYDQTGNLLHAWGGNWGGAVKFSQLNGITIDEQDRIYAVDTLAHTISIFSSEGEFLYQFGGFGGGNGWFSFPSDIAAREQKIYVTDTNNHRVQILEIASSKIMANLDQKGRRSCPENLTVSKDSKGGRRRLVFQDNLAQIKF